MVMEQRQNGLVSAGSLADLLADQLPGAQAVPQHHPCFLWLPSPPRRCLGKGIILQV